MLVTTNLQVHPRNKEVRKCKFVEPTPPVKPSKKRTKKFSEKEDVLLMSAWIEIGMDAVHGNEQSRSTYWQRIHEYFHEHKDFESDHSSNSIMHRWSSIQENVNRFCGWYAQIQNRRQSRVFEQDKVLQACELYKAKDKDGRSFDLLHCWNFFQHEQKWKDRSSQKRQKISANASPRSSTPRSNESRNVEEGKGLTSEPGDERPDGKKKEKEQQCRGKNSISPGENLYMEALENMWAKRKEAEALKEIKKKERNDERIVLEKKRLELKERDLELRQRIEDDKVMNMDISGMSERQQQYFMRMQEEIIARRFGIGSG